MAAISQINFPVSHTKTGIIFAITASSLVFMGMILYIRPGETGANSMVAGGVGEFATCFAIIIFAIYIVFLSRDLANNKYVISIGDQGIFDRRVSTDWIPWSAISAVSIVDRNLQKTLLFKISQSEDVAQKMRRMMISHSSLGGARSPSEFFVEAGKLKGGFTALHNAVTSFHQIPQDGRAE